MPGAPGEPPSLTQTVLQSGLASPWDIAFTPDGAMLFTENLSRAHRVSSNLKAGTVWVNCFFIRDLRTPFGGVKASGFGKDMSVYSLEEYTSVKHVMTDLTGVARKPWHRTVFRHVPTHLEDSPP